MISLVLVSIAGIFKAVMDALQFHYFTSIFFSKNSSFWNPQDSWKNKWKEDLKTEKFLFSSTILVFLTDAWHLFQSGLIFCLMLAIVLYKPIVNKYVDFIILHIVFTGTFELFFSRIFKKR